MLDSFYTINVILEAIAAFVGLIFNGYILFVLLCSKVTVNNLLLLFMALADTTVCLLILICNTPMTFVQQVSVYGPDSSVIDIPNENIDQVICSFQGGLWTVLPLCIIWTICGLIIDRYIAIIEPLSYSRLINVRKTAVLLISIWICMILFAFPPLMGFCQYKFSSSHSGCIVVCSQIENNSIEFYYMAIYFTSFFLPIIIIIICNAHILIIARNHRHRIVSAIYEITIRVQATITHQRSPNYLLRYKGRDAFLTIFQLVGSLIFLTFPYFIIYGYKTFTNKVYDDYWTSTATVLLSLTPIVNGYVYGVKSKALRKTFKRLLQRYLYEQQASIEIDRRLSLRSQSSLREGWNSLLSTSTLSSNMLHRYERRNSAPLSISQVDKFSIRRQSLENFNNFNDTQLKSDCDSCIGINGLTKRPSFLAETKINNKTPLSPIQEISCGGYSENSSVVINSD